MPGFGQSVLMPGFRQSVLMPGFKQSVLMPGFVRKPVRGCLPCCCVGGPALCYA